MTMDYQENAKRHILSIEAAINELFNFQNKTKAPNPLAHQYIGSVVDSTAALLCNAANSLDGKNRYIQFSVFDNWVSLMMTIHRSFFSMIHAALELGIIETCNKLNLETTSSTAKKYTRLLKKVITNNTKEILDLEKYFQKLKPSFQDMLQVILKESKMEEERKKIWINFFKGLTIVRNKSSHSSPNLTEPEKQLLSNGGLATMISPRGDLQMNPRMYAQVVKFVLDFLDELTICGIKLI